MIGNGEIYKMMYVSRWILNACSSRGPVCESIWKSSFVDVAGVVYPEAKLLNLYIGYGGAMPRIEMKVTN